MLKTCAKNLSTKLTSNSKRVMMAIIEGNEEIETVTISNILIRAGNDVKICKINIGDEINEKSKEINLARGLKIVADLDFENEDHRNYDIVILTGGLKGAENYSKSEKLKLVITERIKEKLLYGAICATPALYLAPNKLLLKKATCYPIFSKNILDNGYDYEDAPYYVDDNCVTGRGPGDAMNYALNIVKILNGEEKYNEVKKALILL